MCTQRFNKKSKHVMLLENIGRFFRRILRTKKLAARPTCLLVTRGETPLAGPPRHSFAAPKLELTDCTILHSDVRKKRHQITRKPSQFGERRHFSQFSLRTRKCQLRYIAFVLSQHDFVRPTIAHAHKIREKKKMRQDRLRFLRTKRSIMRP